MPIMTAAIKWERLSALRTPVLMLLAFTALCTGVTTGVFLIYPPAGWIIGGILICACLMFVAYVTDGEGVSGVRSR